MAALWASSKATAEIRPVRPTPSKSVISVKVPAAGEIANDEKSRQYIESLLRQQGITHQATFNNLVFDYLNTPVWIRDEIMNENISQVKEQVTVRQQQIQAQQQAGYNVPSFDVVEKRASFGERMAALWVSSSDKYGKEGPVRPTPSKSVVSVKGHAAGEIANDEKSRQYIESLLRQQGITHQATFNNLVFDYLNTPVRFRDEIMNENIPQVKEQVTVRQQQIQAQQQAGYNAPSFDVVEKRTSFGERMAALWVSSSDKYGKEGPVRPTPSKSLIGVKVPAAGEIANDDESRQYIESLLRQQGITHQATFNNLVFDYLNTPVRFRHEIMNENISQVKEQLTVRQQQIQAQQQAGYNAPSFDVIQPIDSSTYTRIKVLLQSEIPVKLMSL